MRVHRFFISEPVSQDSLRLTDEDVIHQVRDVFRLKKDDTIHLLDNSGFEYEAKIELLTREEAVFHITKTTKGSFAPAAHIHLFYALTKKDTFEWVLEKGTELGVSEFTPIIAERTEKKDINVERAGKIIKEAAEQSGKTVLPVLHTVIKLSDAISGTKKATVFHLSGEQHKMPIVSTEETINIFIGPEGGWSEKEIALFKDAGYSIQTLGSQILRAETAALAVSALYLLS